MLVERYDVFLLDLDGVVYIGEQPLPGAVEALARLRRSGKTVRFLTNDPRPTRAELVERLADMGIAARVGDMVTAGWATADWLRRYELSPAYAVGSPGLVAELRAAGINVVEEGVQAGVAPAVVVVGCDERVTYRHLQAAATYILRGARFVATNADGSFPAPQGRLPATGALVAAIETATGQRPLIIGKPGPTMFAVAQQGLAPGLRTVMVGDSPATDILGAHQVGLPALLVAREPVSFPSPRDPRAPDALIPDLIGLFDPHLLLRARSPATFPWPERVEAGVAAVILDGAGRVLLGRRADNGLWGLPSGHVEPGETVAEAVRREVREEVGLEVAIGSLIGVYSDPVSQVFTYPSGRVSHFITSCFRCTASSNAVCADGVETVEARFFAPNELPSALLPMHPQWLADALAGQAASFVR
jgi:HAD superfamily hydrolase (TIGR01450 family)